MYKTEIDIINTLSRCSHRKIDVICDECGKEVNLEFNTYNRYGYKDGDYLCRNCKREKNNLDKYGVKNTFQLESVKNKSKETMLEKYGVENISQLESNQDKIKKTSLSRYGVEHHLKSLEIKEKIKETMLEKYGVENISQLESIKESKKEEWDKKTDQEKDNILNKRILTNIDRYGVDFTFLTDEVKDKIKITNIKRYGSENPSSSEIIKEKIRVTNIETLNNKTLKTNDNIVYIDNQTHRFKIFCNTCKKNFEIHRVLYYKRKETNNIACTHCNPIDKNISGKELQLLYFIKDNFKGVILNNDKNTIKPYELDIYLPDLKLAFEFNGIYWHSEIYKIKNYHYQKSYVCRNLGIQLMHVWEDDWNLKQDIVKSMILNKLGKTPNKVMARNCEIKEVHDNELVKNFLNNNHIQGYVGSSVKLGLFYKDELVSLMCFKKEWELNRFCNKINTSVIGGASKLFKYFIDNFDYNEIVSFSNYSYSNGDLYFKLGFKKVKELKEDYSYIIDKYHRTHKFNLRYKEKSLKIYDAGKIKFTYLK